MPNWVPNRLFVSGSTKDIKSFRAAVREKDETGKIVCVLSFLTLVPFQSKRQLKRLYRKRMSMSERNMLWCIDHWGTKWNAYDPRLARASATSLLYKFPTAWSPPTAWVQAASKQFPQLRFSLQYWMDGDTTRGIEHIHKGKVKYYRDPELLKDDSGMRM
jgi:hypothetical protein